MRGYREKMAAYRLPLDRRRELRAFCQVADAQGLAMIRSAAVEACGDSLAPWIVRHVTLPAKDWDVLQFEGIPCSVDTFRVYRARFYAILNRMLTIQAAEKAPQGGTSAQEKTPQGDPQQAAGSSLAG